MGLSERRERVRVLWVQGTLLVKDDGSYEDVGGLHDDEICLNLAIDALRESGLVVEEATEVVF